MRKHASIICLAAPAIAGWALVVCGSAAHGVPAEPDDGHGRAQFARHHANVGSRPVYVIPDEKAWDEWPHREVLRVCAKGMLTYRLDEGPDGRPAWKPIRRRADLLDAEEHDVGRMRGGPCLDRLRLAWHIGTDEVSAVPLHERPSPNANSMSELQLIVKPAAIAGAFARVTLVEQLRTKGGAAPPVDATHRLGDKVCVPFTADYVLRDTIGM